MARWRCQDCPAQFGAWLSRCPRCGSRKELVMALWVCTGCTTKYAVGLPRCPHCGSTECVEDGQPMPKNTVHGGPSSAVAEPTQPGYMPPAEAAPEPAAGGAAGGGLLPVEDSPETETLPVDATASPAAPEGSEEPSPGTSSSASTETPQPKSEPSSKPRRKPARMTASRSKKDQTESSSADSTDGGPETGTSASDDKP